MKTNYQKHKAKADRLQKKLKYIEQKYPDFDFRNSSMRSDLTKYWEEQKKLIYAEVDVKACKSDNPDYMCSDCNCWKRSRANCS